MAVQPEQPGHGAGPGGIAPGIRPRSCLFHIVDSPAGIVPERSILSKEYQGESQGASVYVVSRDQR
jgi:hypothetical protein